LRTFGTVLAPAVFMLNLMRKPFSLLLSAALFGCGSDSGDASDSDHAGIRGPDAQTPGPLPAAEAHAPATPPGVSPSDVASPEATPSAEAAPASPATERPRCSPPPGVSGSPSDVEQAVLLMNSLPRPTTLECFVESLDRPLQLYLTSSDLSVQPAEGTRSPRTFIVRGPLVMSVVANREFSSLLEIGYQSAPGRSLKGEIVFPLLNEVTAASISQRISLGAISICGGCHGAETRRDDSFFVDGAFESAVAVPLPPFEVSLEKLKVEAAACQPGNEPERCGLLSALLDHGDVVRSSLWDPR
jgi:hypothetical protein